MRAQTVTTFLGSAALLVSVSATTLAQDEAPGNAGVAGSSATAGGAPVTPVQPVETTTVHAPPPIAPAPQEPVVRLDERTAYMVGNHKLKIGILAFEYGIMQQLSVGSEPPAWALRAFTSVLVPNLHLKFQILDRDPVAVAVLAAAYYADISKSNFDGNLFEIPLSGFVSVKVHPRITLHGEAAFIFARVFGTGDITQASLSGATATRAGQLGLMAQFQVTHVFSITANGRYQYYVADLPLSASAMTDPYTTATLNGQYVPAVQHPWEAFAGVAFLWRHFHLTAGAGYGYYFVPGLDIPNSKKTFVPDGSISVVL
jgi:hypothetical protein